MRKLFKILGKIAGILAGLYALLFAVFYFDLDGTFPNHEANPLEPENLRDLQAAVVAQGADLGLAFDGDADRCFVVDERGEPVSPSAITALIATREIARAVAAGTDAADVAIVQADHRDYARLAPADVQGVRLLVDGRRVTDAALWQGVPRLVIGTGAPA